jgi:hypothetical protein
LETLELPEISEEKEPSIEKLLEIDLSKIPSPVLARLIDEVRNEEVNSIDAYSRFHNRHNRSR